MRYLACSAASWASASLLAADQHLQLDLGGDLRAGHVGVQGADEHVHGFVGGAQVHRPAVAGDFLDQLEVVVPADVDTVGAEGAVDRAEAPVHAADVDQVLQDPARHPLVLGGGPGGGLGGDARQQPGHYLLVVGAGVEVHVEGDQVDRGQRDLRHGVDPVLAYQIGLADVEVVQRGGAGEGAQAPGQALVGGRARRRGDEGLRRGRESHDGKTRR